MDLCASIQGFHHHHHPTAGELNAREDLRSSWKCSLAFVATNLRLRGTNEIRHLHQEDKNSNTNIMRFHVYIGSDENLRKGFLSTGIFVIEM